MTNESDYHYKKFQAKCCDPHVLGGEEETITIIGATSAGTYIASIKGETPTIVLSREAAWHLANFLMPKHLFYQDVKYEIIHGDDVFGCVVYDPITNEFGFLYPENEGLLLFPSYKEAREEHQRITKELLGDSEDEQ